METPKYIKMENFCPRAGNTCIDEMKSKQKRIKINFL